MAHLAIGTTQPLIPFALPFGLTPIMIPEPRQFPQMAVEEMIDESSQKPAKKHKKYHNVRFKVNLCEVYEIPNRITLRELANAVSPVTTIVSELQELTTTNSLATVIAPDIQDLTNADNIIVVSVEALHIIIQCARKLDP